MALSAFILSLAATQANPGATLIDRTRADRLPTPPVRASAVKTDPSTVVANDAPAVTITGIRFTGVAAPERVALAGRRFIGRKAARQTLGELAAALAAAYVKSNVALYTVAIPEQDFHGGTVRVLLVEGRIAGIDFGRPAGPALRARLKPLTTEQPLSRSTFERQLSLARAIPGLKIDTDLTNPAGGSDLRLKVTPNQKRHKLSAGYTSRGVDLLGAGQLNLSGEAYGMLVDGDQLSAGLAAAPDLRRFRLVTAGYAAPVGPTGLIAALNGAYLETRPKRRSGKGTAKQVAASLVYPVVRTFTSAGDVSLSLDGLDSDDATIAGIVARERSRVLRLAASYSKVVPTRSWSAAVSFSRGLNALGTRLPGSNAEFFKMSGSANFAQSIGKRLTARIAASGQLSRNVLPAAERFAIGGEAIGRAFDDALLSGDRGGGGSLELAWRTVAKGHSQQSELYGFLDAGSVRVLARGPFPAQNYSLDSAGLGGRLRYREKAELGVEAARVVKSPYATYPGRWQITASWRLTI